jgi:hypothetical protein
MRGKLLGKKTTFKFKKRVNSCHGAARVCLFLSLSLQLPGNLLRNHNTRDID